MSSSRINFSSYVKVEGSINVVVNNTLPGGREVNRLYAYGNAIAFNFVNTTGIIDICMSTSTGSNIICSNTFWYCYNYSETGEIVGLLNSIN